MASVRSCQKFSLCLMDSRAADCKVNPPQLKAKPISNGGSAYGITDLRRGKVPFRCRQRERRVRICEKKTFRGDTWVTPLALLPFWCLLSTG